jgi:hypothetical protein
MPRLILVGAILGFFVSTTPSSMAATDAANHVTTDISSQAGGDLGGYEFAAPPATNADVICRVNRATGEVGACVFSAKGRKMAVRSAFPQAKVLGRSPRAITGWCLQIRPRSMAFFA